MNKTHAALAEMQNYIKPLNMNGLEGRMLKMPVSRKSKNKGAQKREILLLYGHHASLERMFGFCEVLSDYGTVTMPDLPGFGGMDSMHKLGMEPTYDALADYLASFIKLRYRGKKFMIAGFSLGFVIATRMLQRYPELAKQVTLLVSIAGFTHKYDFTFSPMRRRMYLTLSSLFKRKLPAAFFFNVALHPSLLRRAYVHGHNSKAKFKDLTQEELNAALDFEVTLWRINDVRTYMSTGHDMLTLDNCTAQVDMPVHHIAVSSDQYFDADTVEQHMRVIFTDYKEHISTIDRHAPSVISTKEDALPLFPDSIFTIIKAH